MIENISDITHNIEDYLNEASYEELLDYYLHKATKKEWALLKWVKPDVYIIIKRKKYISECVNHEPIHICPECGGNIISDEWGEEYCNTCGLVTRSYYDHVAGQPIILPFGLK